MTAKAARQEIISTSGEGIRIVEERAATLEMLPPSYCPAPEIEATTTTTSTAASESVLGELTGLYRHRDLFVAA